MIKTHSTQDKILSWKNLCNKFVDGELNALETISFEDRGKFLTAKMDCFPTEKEQHMYVLYALAKYGKKSTTFEEDVDFLNHKLKIILTFR